MKKCKEENCKEKYYAKEYCRKHYRLYSGEYKKRYRTVRENDDLYKATRKSQIRYINRVKNTRWYKDLHNARQRKYYHSIDGLRKEYLLNWKEDLLFGGLRDDVLKRDQYRCQICGMTEDEHYVKYNRDLSIHHKDHKGLNVAKIFKNNTMENLITLCLSCHGKEDKKIK